MAGGIASDEGVGRDAGVVDDCPAEVPRTADAKMAARLGCMVGTGGEEGIDGVGPGNEGDETGVWDAVAADCERLTPGTGRCGPCTARL